MGLGIAAAVRAHHENWNGTGYPDALAADSIPLWARIIRVADSFDAMTQSRGHRPTPLPCDQAIEELLSGQGKQYDPRICEAVGACKGALIAAFNAPLRAA
ncbi:HD domain-containing protein [Candidatus Sumerlaeota bacterium]|nr:HD domain-containing protein [Candidatus Sumerlaeota bacterium]